MYISTTGGLIAAASKKAAKPTQQLGAITAVERIVLTMQQAGVFPIVVVTGVEADEVKYRLAGRGVVFLHNAHFDAPELMESARQGLAYLHGKCRQVAFTPVNVPLFSPATLRALLRHSAPVVTPEVDGRGGHPVLLADEVIPEVLAYTGGEGLRGALQALEGRRLRVPVQDEGVLLTIHQPARLKALLQQSGRAFIHPYLQLGLEKESLFFNPRAKLLLWLIADTHSVRAAAAQMALSYSKAWEMLNGLERQLGYAVIHRRQGGPSGSRSDLTPRGYEFLAAYQQFVESVMDSAAEEFDKRLVQGGVL